MAGRDTEAHNEEELLSLDLAGESARNRLVWWSNLLSVDRSVMVGVFFRISPALIGDLSRKRGIHGCTCSGVERT